VPQDSAITRRSSTRFAPSSTSVANCATNASPLLRRLRREIQEQREDLLARLESLMRSAGASPTST
jgi:hypothetical protein